MLKFLKSVTLIGLCFGVVQAVNVSGVVKNASTGKPVSNAVIICTDEKYNIIREKTGADGSYSFKQDISVGQYSFSAEADAYSDTFVEVTITGNDPVIINFVLGTIDGKEVTYTPVKGTVSDTSGKPIGNVRIIAGKGYETFTGADGKFSFDNIPLMDLFWDISHKAYADTSFNLTLAANPSEMEFRLVPLAISSISGIVKEFGDTNKPIEGVKIAIKEYGGSEEYYDTTDIKGAYSFDSIPAFEMGWSIRFYKEGYEDVSDDIVIAPNKPEIIDIDMILKGSTGIAGLPVSSFSTAPAFRYSSGVLKLVNINEPGEMRVFNLNGKLLFRQNFNWNCSVIPLPRNIISNRTTLIVNINAGKNSLKQAIIPFN